MSAEPDRLAVLVHEVRSPVAALRAIADAVARGDVEVSALAEVATLAVAACRVIERVVTDVAVASVRREEVDAGALARATVDAACLGGARARAEVQPGRLLRVLADPVRLRQALDNLVANALLHGSPADEILVAARARGGEVELSVTDAGEGIAPAEQRRILEAGVRLHPDRPGAGLGLAVTKAIVEAHGGELTVQSTPGRGATFTIALPGA